VSWILQMHLIWILKLCGGLPLLRGVDPRGVDLPEVWTSLLILHTLIVASTLLHAQLSTAKCRFYPCILDSTTAFAL
jgi:hypothetical protein